MNLVEQIRFASATSLDLEQIADRIEALEKDVDEYHQVALNHVHANEELRKQLASAQAEIAQQKGGEPVAWRRKIAKWLGGDNYETDYAVTTVYSAGCEPLFTAAPRGEQVETLRRDAERYRYIRDDGNDITLSVRVVSSEDDGYVDCWLQGFPPDELDAAIDAARKGEE